MALIKSGFLGMFVMLLFQGNERERIFIDNSSEQVLLAFNDLPILVDSTGTMTFQEVVNSQKQFIINPGYKPKDYCVDCTYWVKVPLLIANSLDKQWMLDCFHRIIT